MDPSIQGAGLGRELLQRSLQAIRHQWAEVVSGHEIQKRLLSSEGFAEAESWATVLRYLGHLLGPLVTDHQEDPPFRYRRRTSMPPYVVREYTFMIHGSPTPLALDAKPYQYHPEGLN